MMISGHKTKAVFERYNIVNENDFEDGSQKTGRTSEFSDGHNFRHTQ